MDSESQLLNVAALGHLMHEHLDALSAYISRQLPQDLLRLIDTQDVVQDTFFEAFQRLSEFVPGKTDTSRAWLMSIARNRIVTLIRMHRTAKRGGGEVLSEAELCHESIILMLQDFASHTRTPSKSASRRELAVLIEKSLGSLQPDYLEAVRLRYIEGLSLKDTAVRMNRSEDSAQKLCARALAALRVELRTISLYV